MNAPARTSLPDLPKGHEFFPTTFELTANDVERYLAAVEDGNDVYRESGLAPPLAVAARALGALLELIELPAGSLHTGQEIEARAGVAAGSKLTLAGRVAQRSERGGVVIAALEFEVTPEGAAAPALAGKTTVLMPA